MSKYEHNRICPRSTSCRKCEANRHCLFWTHRPLLSSSVPICHDLCRTSHTRLPIEDWQRMYKSCMSIVRLGERALSICLVPNVRRLVVSQFEWTFELLVDWFSDLSRSRLDRRRIDSMSMFSLLADLNCYCCWYCLRLD